MKLKNIRKGDTIILFNTIGDKTDEIPYQVTHIEFKNDQVLDMILVNQYGHKKHYGFLDKNMEIKTGVTAGKVCPCCGR